MVNNKRVPVSEKGNFVDELYSIPRSILLNNRLQNMIQSICFDFIHRGKILAELSLWKALPAEPFQIVNRQRGDIPTFILAKRHTGANKLDEKI